MKREKTEQEVFGAMLCTATMLETVADRHLAPWDLTVKQWQLSLVLERNGAPVTLSQAAESMGTSRQNVKQIALKLESKGFCTITEDPYDRRILRIGLTERNRSFWDEIAEANNEFMKNLFSSIDGGTLNAMRTGLIKIFRELAPAGTAEKLIGKRGK